MEYSHSKDRIFSGNIFIFHSFDIGEDIDLKAIQKLDILFPQSLTLPKYFKNYHSPISIELPRPNQSYKSYSVKIQNFGVVSLGYKIHFKSTLEELRKQLNGLDNQYKEQSVEDLNSIFNIIKPYVKQAKFFHIRSSYLIIQVDQQKDLDVVKLKRDFAGIIASMLKFETKTLSEYQKNEILNSSIGYFRGDLIVIDTEASFVYDDEYEEILDLFEFANIQQLELQYFDKILDQQLNIVYEREVRSLPFRAYLPFIGTDTADMVGDLERLKVDISVITERLESSIMFAGEAYFSELYELIIDKLDLDSWKESIEKKLSIVKDIRMVYKNKADIIREDLLSVLIIALIFIELIIGLLHYLK